jgi:hypothetical protein
MKKLFKTKLGTDLNRKSIQEIRELKAHICQYCHKENYYTEKLCESCYAFINRDKPQSAVLKTVDKFVKKAIYWTCAYCKVHNKEDKTFCEYCKKNKTTVLGALEESKAIEQKYRVSFNKVQKVYCKLCLDQYVKPNSLYCENCNKKRGPVSTLRQASNNPLSLELKNNMARKNVTTVMDSIEYDLGRSGIMKSEFDSYDGGNVTIKKRANFSPSIIHGGNYSIGSPNKYTSNMNKKLAFDNPFVKGKYILIYRFFPL